ncbi:MAG: PHP domain-containing protein, partial [Bacilli bacterium]|nr:PHP domain-containing protein [Bacilli bacterium]
MANFIPLHIHTGYSFLESGILLERLFNQAQKYNYQYLGITDFEAMYGIPEFNMYAKKNNITPIFGIDLSVDENKISLFVKNETGYKNLTQLVAFKNKAKLGDFKLTLKDVKQFSEGLICVVPTEENAFFDVINDTTRAKMFEFCTVFENLFI